MLVKTHGNWRSEFANYVVTAEEYNSRTSWDDLTQEEKDLVCDGGCGLKIFGKKIIPDFIFKDCCCHHDFAYLRGGDERVRLLCDSAFYSEMKELLPKSAHPKYYKFWAQTYASAVKRWGWLSWDYGPMRTKEQILEAAAISKAMK